MANIFHILPRKDWEEAKKQGSYAPLTLKTEGFIHCSKADQLLLVANSFFKGKDGLVILRIVEAKISSKLVYEIPKEAPQSTVKYPHIYGPLNLDAVEAVISFPHRDDGRFDLPEDLLK
ncbi:MAG: DUF952 domain-containing protein [Bdellovibrio sp.]